MTLLKDNNYKDINVALLSLEADIKNKTGFDTSEIDKQLAEINSRIDKINAGGSSNSSAVINDVREEIEDINSKLNANSVRIESIEQKLSDIFSAENKVTDFNTTTDSGIYYWVADAANKPGTDYGVLLVNKYDNGSGSLWINQIAYSTTNKIYFRQNINSGNWTEWKAVAFDGEITAKKVANALTVNGKTYDGSSAVNAGVQTVANGGTGATDAASGFNALADGVRDSSTPRDDEKMLLKPSGTWYKTTCLDFWNYIKDKISSVLGLTKDNYGGTAATILDYNRNTPIKVRWGGPGIDSAEWYPAFNADGSAIEPINRTNIHAGTADRAISDANGNNIVNTYATKTDIENTTTKTLNLNTVSTNTTKYIKLGTFHWNDSISLRCRLYGDSFEDVVNINILNGNTTSASVCGYYSTNNQKTRAIIVKRGDNWSSDIEIYLQVTQHTTLNIDVTIDEKYQDRINISESTTAPSGKLEEIAFNSINGMFSNNIDAKNLTLRNGTIEDLNTFGNEPLSIGTPSDTNLGIDHNSIQARNNGAADALYLNYYGGSVQIGNNNVTGTKLILKGKTVSSNSYTDTNPKLEFKNPDGSQNISLTFTDFDAVQAPASLTLNGNQGNEYFIAPCIKANNRMVIPIGAPSSPKDGDIWIER